MRPTSRFEALTLLVALGNSLGCQQQSLAPSVARVQVIPQPQGDQQHALTDALGLDLGQVPLFGVGTATFKIQNLGSAILRITGSEVRDAVAGTFTVQSLSAEIPAFGEDGELVVTFVPAAKDAIGSATIALQTNAGDKQDQEVLVVVRGVGLWVGDPHLAVCVMAGATVCTPLNAACVDRGDGQNACTFDPIDFGTVALGLSGSAKIQITNLPPTGTCQAPAGSPDCTPACRLVVDKNPAGYDVGFGFDPPDAGFSANGNVTVPFAVDAPSPTCGASGEVTLALQFAAGDVERDGAATLRIESNDPTRPFNLIPLLAKAREAPVAVARLRPCDVSPPPNCSTAADIHPLAAVYLDGSQSYDQHVPPAAITTYAWTVLEAPLGTDPGLLNPHGFDTASADLFLPLAGRYLVHLTVGNALGMESADTPESNVEILAVPTNRLHVELVWDNATNDQDLHLVNAAVGDTVCDVNADCFWGDCKPTCPNGDGCRASPPDWFPPALPREGPNPRLDIDDTHGLGPENINIDAPEAGTYDIYVHYYGLVDLTTTPTVDTVRIWIDGLLAAEFHRTLGRSDLWRVAQIQWGADGSASVVAAGSDSGGVGQVKSMLGCSQPFSFGAWY